MLFVPTKPPLSPAELTNAFSDYLIDILKPARDHFSKGEAKKMLSELDAMISKK